jgi:hypothetical protein
MVMKIKQICFRLSMFLPLLLIPYRVDNDTWFLLNCGRYVMEHGIPHIEPFTLHAGMHFCMQQWLTSILYWNVYAGFGLNGLYVLTLLWGTILLYTLYRLCLLVSRRNIQVAVLCTTLIGCVAYPLFLVMRPWVLSGLLLLLTLICLEKYAQMPESLWPLLPIPLFSALLVNCHASVWVMILVVFLPFLAEKFLPCRVKKKYFPGSRQYALRPLLLAMAAAFLAGFLNPYGWEAMSYVVRSYGVPEINAFVNEMQPLTVKVGAAFPVAAVLMAVLFGVMQQRLPLRYVCFAIGTGYMAASALRSVFLFLLLGVFPLAYLLKNWHFLGQGKESVQPFNYRWAYALLLIVTGLIALIIWRSHDELSSILAGLSWLTILVDVILLVAMLTMIIVVWRRGYTVRSCYQVLSVATIILALLLGTTCLDMRYAEPSFTAIDAAPVDFLLEQAAPEDIRCWTDYNNGTYPEFCGIKCYLDTRAEVFLPANNGQQDYLAEYIALQTGRLHYREFLSRYAFTHILAEKDVDILYTYLAEDDDFAMIYDDGQYRIFQPR